MSQLPEALQHLVVPSVPHDSTTLLQHSPTDEDDLSFKTILSPASSIVSQDQCLKSAGLLAPSETFHVSDKSLSNLNEHKELALVTIPQEDISKTAVVLDDSNDYVELGDNDDHGGLDDNDDHDRVIEPDNNDDHVVEPDNNDDHVVELDNTNDHVDKYQIQEEEPAIEEKGDNESADEATAREDYMASELFRLQHGFRREELALVDQGQDYALSALQGLTLMHRLHTGNFMMLVEQLRAMRSAAVAIQLEDVDLLRGAVEKCERVLQRHQAFDLLLRSEPTQHDVMKALHELVRTCYRDTTELIEDWALVFHSLQDLIQRLQSISIIHGAVNGNTGNIKSPKAKKSLFSRKSSTGVTHPHISPETLQYQKDVCANWVAQMEAFEQLAKAYRAYAHQVTEFSLIQEVEGVARFCGEEISTTYEKARAEFANTQKLSALHHQIDYTNFNRVLPKENALTTAAERELHPSRRLFTTNMIGHRRLIREGKLKAFTSPFAAATNNKKKNIAPATPKDFRLIVTSDMVYLCEVVPSVTEGQDLYNVKGSKKAGQNGTLQKQLRLLHEPVLVIDSQISSTPDVVHPPLIQKNIVMVCFYNQTIYILQADSSEERDAWIECSRQLDIEQPKPTEACQEQGENEEIQLNTNYINTGTFGKNKGQKMSLLKRLRSIRRVSTNLSEEAGPMPEIDLSQTTRTEEEEKARHMQHGQPSLWGVRRLPFDLSVIPPLEHPIPFRKSHLYDSNIKIVDLTTGRIAPGEFGMGIEDRAAYFRDECALFAVLCPARLIPFNEIDRQRDDFFLCCKRLHKGEVMFAEPPYNKDFYARSWLHPEMHIEFDAETQSIMVARMYRIICSTSEIVVEFQKYHDWLMQTARISPDNTFLCMDYRSGPLHISKRIERVAGGGDSGASMDMDKDLEAGRQYTGLGECNIEFRRMSNTPDALSVGFYNPATKRDMAIGAMVFDKTKAKATASSLGLSALNALGPSNGVARVSATEISLTLWQTDARTRPTFIKGRRVFETVKTKALDTFKITGPREALDELEDFMRVKNGTDCMTREIDETFRLIRIAFQDEVLDAPLEEDELDVPRISSSGSQLCEMIELGQLEDEAMSCDHTTDERLVTVLEEKDPDVLRMPPTESQLCEPTEFDQVEDEEVPYNHTADEHLEAVLKEDEPDVVRMSSNENQHCELTELDQVDDEVMLCGHTADKHLETVLEEEDSDVSRMSPSGNRLCEAPSENQLCELTGLDQVEAEVMLCDHTADEHLEIVLEEEDPAVTRMSPRERQLCELTELDQVEEETTSYNHTADEHLETVLEEHEPDVLRMSPSENQFRESTEFDQGDDQESSYNHTVDGHLEAVLNEGEDDEHEGSLDAMSSSTDTFRPKSRSALMLMHHQQLAAEETSEKDLESLPLIENSCDDSASFLECSLNPQEDRVEEAIPPTPSVANLTEFWAKTTGSTVSLTRSSSSLNMAVEPKQETTAAANDRSASEQPVLATAPTTELEARLNAVRSAVVSHVSENAQYEVNSSGVVQSTRYLPKRSHTLEGILAEDLNTDFEPGVSTEHHMPVKDLKERWEEICRLGI
ncbi:hypothetical protein EDD11_005692 [Mortierella claussenii]|nr:hypothetical protein EDD11_005692 [Mortierella claussenii]